MKLYMGVDVGGTFTDSVVADDRGNLYIFKTPTVVANPAQGFMNCVKKAADSFGIPIGEFLESLEKLGYGTTAATNMLIEGRAAKTGLITTKGFRDTLPIMRIGRDSLGIDLQCERPPALTPRSLIEEVSERIDFAGRIVTPLDEGDVEAAIESLGSRKVEAIAVALLNSFRNPIHERKIREAISHKLPGVYVCISSDIAPVIGEYERTATAVVNASLGPPMKKQMNQLLAQLEKNGNRVPLMIMQSTGGVVPAEDAALRPVTLVNSGPAGGLIASKYIAELLGLQNAICIDMGGTSLDTSLTTGAEYSASLVSKVCGHDVYVPQLDIDSIGAGGGSIAWLDIGKRLKVGPRSAGANPGPVCYDSGGMEPTVTDADLLLGRLNPDYFLGGEIKLNAEKAKEAIEQKIARPLRLTLMEAVHGICRIVDANMAGAIRAVTIQKGHDPRDYAMIAFGGAGPMHCAALAKELGIRTVIIPSLATALSAFGIAISDVVHSLSLSSMTEISDFEKINKHVTDLKKTGYDMLKRERIDNRDIEMRLYADVRYKMQSHEVTLPVPDKTLASGDVSQLIESFESKYERMYGAGTLFRQAGMEIVTFRVDAVGKKKKPGLKATMAKAMDASKAIKAQRDVFFEGSSIPTRIYDGNKLGAGSIVEGPAIVEYTGTTAVIYPDQMARLDQYLNLILTGR